MTYTNNSTIVIYHLATACFVVTFSPTAKSPFTPELSLRTYEICRHKMSSTPLIRRTVFSFMPFSYTVLLTRRLLSPLKSAIKGEYLSLARFRIFTCTSQTLPRHPYIPSTSLSNPSNREKKWTKVNKNSNSSTRKKYPKKRDSFRITFFLFVASRRRQSHLYREENLSYTYTRFQWGDRNFSFFPF